MLDIKWILANPELFDIAMARRGVDTRAADIVALNRVRLDYDNQLQDISTQRNRNAETIGLRKRNKENADDLILLGSQLKAQADELLRQVPPVHALNALLQRLPNVLDDSVPEGSDETANQIVGQYRLDQPLKQGRQHFEISKSMDFETAGKISGSRFVVLKGNIARLERALGQFMLDFHTENHGYTEVNVPVLVNTETLYGTGQLPKFEEDLYRVGDKWLIPTAEVPLTNLAANSITETGDTQRYTALSNCFRSEAGASGRDVRGMLRQHQFNKVELVSIVQEEQAQIEFLRTVGCAGKILELLDLPYRVMDLCSGDTGFSAKHTYDIEVWLPGQNAFREISSISWCGDFQARRMNARYRDEQGNVRFFHTINGSGLAVGRTLIAVLENFTDEFGWFHIPRVLQRYLGNVEVMGI